MSKAEAFARMAHRDQRYGGEPYTVHLCEVVRIVQAYSFPTMIDAAWLHDVIEDTRFGHREIEQEFGSDTAAIVWACTGTGKNRIERCRSIYRKITRLPAAAVVKTADRIANVEAAHTSGTPKHLERYRNEALDFEYYVARYTPDAMQERLRTALR